MAAGLISEDDIQRPSARLREVFSETLCLQFFGKDRWRRLEKIGGGTISHHFLIDVIVRQQGPQLLAERPVRFGNQTTSIRKVLLQALTEAELKRPHTAR